MAAARSHGLSGRRQYIIVINLLNIRTVRHGFSLELQAELKYDLIDTLVAFQIFKTPTLSKST